MCMARAAYAPSAVTRRARTGREPRFDDHRIPTRWRCAAFILASIGRARRRTDRRWSVSRYILRRLLIAVPTLIAISFVLYVILALAPIDPLSSFGADPRITPEVRE